LADDDALRFAVAFDFDFDFDEDLGGGIARGYPTDETSNSSSAFCA
jgi:hypothetical protein